MATRQEQRSEETKASILSAAGRLFSAKGYEAVTMREIAKEAGCSHTTIYIYFKDKEALLQQLSLPPLLSLMDEMKRLSEEEVGLDARLENLSLAFIEFCFHNRNTYNLFINVKSGRVDNPAPEMEINRVRGSLFNLLTDALRNCLSLDPADERLLTYSRIYFFAIYGIVATYAHSEETVEGLLERLTPTFRTAFKVLIAGFREEIGS
ncbi:TetR/AcrR family transcriptional regulator [Cohnella terricola]|uniref:TetR/AcrR family transcriptional regulator n=1 Tax=Cohnella terricola TaxID=1289167 RepID=A0A559JH00_9BACL|nr:TetR/AcrR family transcriptional regulator [Cohnella terricola]TVX99138.1 TetR/AcrR family transcriptional regulator [Cohnella terricola]